MVRFGASAGRVALAGLNGEHRFETDVVLNPHESRRARLNGDGLRSADRLRHELRTLVFTPDRLAIVKGGPATRRAYLDRSLGRLLPAKAALGVEYAAAVGQRNAALRRLAIGVSSRSAVTPWTESVASLGVELVRARLAAVELLSAPFAAAADFLGLLSATLAYEGEPVSVADLEARLEKDLERGVTGAGPHLHDLRIAAGGLDLRAFGSQGEQRLAVLALLLAEAETLAATTGIRPLVLLDDVLSELDGDRRRSLATLVSDGGQTVVTAAAFGAFPAEPAQALVVTPGRLRVS